MDSKNTNNNNSNGSVMDVQSPSNKPNPLDEVTDPLRNGEEKSTDQPVSPPGVDLVGTPELPAKVKHGKPVGAIVMAVVIAVGIAALAAFAYIKTNNTAQPASTQPTTTQQDAATPKDVDDANSDVDDSINSTNEAQDFPDNDLTDAALGL